jgi:hypothetical protein
MDAVSTTGVAMPRAGADARTEAAAIPWYLWCAAGAITSITVGLYWDISWHISVGRDTFWTPAHLAIHFGGVLAALSCGYLILTSTVGRDARARETSVRIWGLRGPLGAFLCSWGGFTMLTSAPFDDWWHNAYGLDVKIISPPHVVLLTGMLAVGFGALVLVVGHRNRAEGEARRRSTRLLLYVGSMLLLITAMFVMEYTDRTQMHAPLFYRVVSIAFPVGLLGIAAASEHRLACTIVTAWYTVMWLVALWVFPLFPATAKLGPVLTPVTHMVPLGFPLLLLPAAWAVDLVRARSWGGSRWLAPIVVGTVFLAVFLAVQWPFAEFLMQPAARSRIFGAHYFSYMDDPAEYALSYRFEESAPITHGLPLTLGVAILSSAVGMLWGAGIRRVRR